MIRPSNKRIFNFEEYTVFTPKKDSKQYRIISEISLTKSIKNSFIREVSLEILQPSDEDTLSVISLKTHSLRLQMNGEAKIHKKLAIELAKVYDELILKLRFNGSISSIVNFEGIKNKWVIICKEIESSYEGREIEKLLSKVSDKLSSEKLVIQELHQYNFFGLLLKSIYGIFNNVTPVVQKQWFIIDSNPIEVNEQILLEENTEDQVLLKCFINENQYKNISYSGTFCFDKENHLLKSGVVTISEETRESVYKLMQIE